MSTTAVFLSTFNGSRFLSEQLNSIIEQSFTGWQLYIRDDGSSDETLEIIGRFTELDDRIHNLSSIPTARLGPKNSFAKLLSYGYAQGIENYFLCDQDDVWHPDKMAKQLDSLMKIQGPGLVSCKVQLTDENMQYSGKKPAFEIGGAESQLNISGLLSRNCIPGCTMAFNRQLVELAMPIPEVCVMHDWWIALAAVSAGELNYIGAPLVYYRQHAENVVGGRSIVRIIFDVGSWLAVLRKGGEELSASIKQAELLADRLESRGRSNESCISVLREYSSLFDLKRRDRLGLVRELGLRESSLLLRWMLYIHVLGRLSEPGK
ncbi:MAG: glycosyltransferase family 2 protein [Halioglobus sp.]